LTHTPEDNATSEPLEFFSLGRRIRHGLAVCAQTSATRYADDVFYLWMQMGAGMETRSLSEDEWLNIIDEAASLGVNWLVVTLGPAASRAAVPAICRWARDTHGMTVCVHAAEGGLRPEEREMLLELRGESCILLVDPAAAGDFADLEAEGVSVAQAAPAVPEEGSACDFPARMVYVDPSGRLYTCGLVAGDEEFYLGSVLDGSLDAIMHNPRLPHCVTPSEPVPGRNCSGCPPLVAQHLCQK
jgi:radical SAM protein with 4Fe4S-binding SPASM domain